MKTLSWSAGIALLAIAVCAPTAGAETVKCQKAIAKSSSQFVQAKVKALAKCEEGIVKTGTGGPCPDAKAAATISKAETKMRSTIDKTCGGADKVCNGTGVGEDTPASLGWPSICPNFEKGTCTNPIADCGDIADCLSCINESAVDQAIDLYYGDLVLPSTGNKPLNSCQISIGKATAAFLGAKSKALQKCWDARLAGKHGNSCAPPAVGDGKYLAAISKADAKKRATICKACGGTDKLCGGGDDLTPAVIGFPANCPPVTIPGGAACGGPITDLQGIVDCVDCVTEFKVDCADRLQVPEFAAYPTECNACTLPAPSGPCPTTLSFTANGADTDLDTGFTGLAHDSGVPTNGRLSLTVSACAGGSQPTCGQCNVNGPIDNSGGAAFANHRCQDEPWVPCTTDLDCTTAGAIGPCTYFFGGPLPLRAGGVSTCIMNRVAGPVSGTINFDDGTSTTNVPLTSQVATSGSEFSPCPQCSGGTCQDGPRIGQPCSVNGSGIYGDISLDCPPQPAAVVATLGINLNIATGVQTRTVSAANATCRATGFTALKCLCDTCNDLPQDACATNADCPVSGGQAGICGGLRCLGGPVAGDPCNQCMGGTNHGAKCSNDSACPGGACPVVCGTCLGGINIGLNCNANAQCPGSTCSGQCNRPGQDTKPNACNSIDDPPTGCVDVGGNEGECADGPVDLVCSIQKFRTCTGDADCQAPACPLCLPGQTCIAKTRPCFPGNGVIGSSVTVSGSADVPCGGVSKPTVGTFFCVAPVGASAVNAASGLPGLGRVRIPGIVLVNP